MSLRAKRGNPGRGYKSARDCFGTSVPRNDEKGGACLAMTKGGVSLRAKRGNPGRGYKSARDCFVANAPRNDKGGSASQ